MLTGRLMGWIQRRHTLRVFLLEIFAIFIGITASLVVDDWRQSREEQERLIHLLEEIHFSVILDRAHNRGEQILNTAALSSTLSLAYDDPDAMSDDTLLRHFVIAGPVPAQSELPTGSGRFSSTVFSLPYDRTLAGIEGDFRELGKGVQALNDTRDQILDLVGRLQSAASRPADISRSGLDGLSKSASDQVSELFSLLRNTPGYLADVNDAETARAALRTPAVRALLVDLISRRADAGVRLAMNNTRLSSVISTIRAYSPGISLPIDAIGIDGDATEFGWSDVDGPGATSNTVPMRQSDIDSNLWTTTLDLKDGEIKFRADNSWIINWGVPRDARNLTGTGAQFVFGGNADDYFPSGIAEIRGINIPVRAGRYRVFFNSQSFEYRFEREE